MIPTIDLHATMLEADLDTLLADAAPCVIADLSNEVYHRNAGVSKSGLDLIRQSPAHYWSLTQDPQRPPRKAKQGQLEGSLAHCAVLEPLEFAKRYRVGPAVNRNTTKWKDFVEACKPDGVEPIQHDQHDVAFAQAESIRSLPEVARALDAPGGMAELSGYWRDPKTGVLCRCRPDFTAPMGQGVVLLDVKTFSRAQARPFQKQAAQKRYFAQDAFYSDGFALAAGVPVLAFIFVVVETEWPYAAASFVLDADARQAGRDAYRADLDVYARCAESGVWPGYSTAITVIGLPQWAFTEENQ